jgi:DNA-binding transcriptional regulator YdaS (Cro superfamily)
MTKDEAISFFGSASELARRLDIERSAISQWTEIPEGRQYQIEVLTEGKLRAERPTLARSVG